MEIVPDALAIILVVVAVGAVVWWFARPQVISRHDDMNDQWIARYRDPDERARR